jgi:hypothetical protein
MLRMPIPTRKSLPEPTWAHLPARKSPPAQARPQKLAPARLHTLVCACLKIRKYEKVWESMRKYEKVWESMRKYEKVRESLRKYEKVSSKLRKYGKVSNKLRK